MTAQRIRLLYRKGARLRFLSHLDVLRAMERAIRRAGLPLAYSEGFTPHPKLAFASPLPLGFEGESEIVDITLTERVDASSIVGLIRCKSSEDLQPLSAYEVPLRALSPQASSRWADYRVELPDVDPAEAERRARAFLSAGEFEWTETRQGKQRTYDLRALVVRIGCAPLDSGGTRMTMRLAASNEATGRPEQVVAALFPDTTAERYARTEIILDEPSPARQAWRKVGRYI